MSLQHEIIVDKVRIDWSKNNRGRLFKNHHGSAWLGNIFAGRKINNEAIMLLKNPKKITYGLWDGSSDLIGWEYVEFELNIKMPNFINPIIPVFCCVEIKTISSPKITDDQILWLNEIVKIGGRAYVARETKDNYKLEEWKIK